MHFWLHLSSKKLKEVKWARERKEILLLSERNAVWLKWSVDEESVKFEVYWVGCLWLCVIFDLMFISLAWELALNSKIFSAKSGGCLKNDWKNKTFRWE